MVFGAINRPPCSGCSRKFQRCVRKTSDTISPSQGSNEWHSVASIGRVPALSAAFTTLRAMPCDGLWTRGPGLRHSGAQARAGGVTGDKAVGRDLVPADGAWALTRLVRAPRTLAQVGTGVRSRGYRRCEGPRLESGHETRKAGWSRVPRAALRRSGGRRIRCPGPGRSAGRAPGSIPSAAEPGHVDGLGRTTPLRPGPSLQPHPAPGARGQAAVRRGRSPSPRDAPRPPGGRPEPRVRVPALA